MEHDLKARRHSTGRWASRMLRVAAVLVVGWLVAAVPVVAGSLEITAESRYVGRYGLELTVDSVTPVWLEDDHPTAEPAYRVRFYVNLDLLTMAGGDELDMLVASAVDGTGVLRLSLDAEGADRRLRLATRLDDGSERTLECPALPPAGWRAAEVGWRAASAEGAGDGWAVVLVDGAVCGQVDDLDNDTLRVDTVRWGAVAALDPGTSGTLWLDQFESGRRLPIGLHPVFVDVPAGYLFQAWILAIYGAGVTAGCGPSLYCPELPASRGQMAVFLLKAAEGSHYVPPACTVPTFSDVPCSYLFAAWIEEIAARGITVGCGPGVFCPESPVSRGQMAVFLLKTVEGSDYTPPACTVPTFDDVPCSHPFAAWIEEIAARGITAGCGPGVFCPESPVSRGQMAVFLTKTFDLPLPTLSGGGAP